MTELVVSRMLAHEFQARTGITRRVSSNDEDAQLPRAVSTALFRIHRHAASP